jgi:hypothetical protein
LREPLLIVANKLLGRQRLSFEQLTTSEQDLWNKFETSDIYEFLTGESDTVPELCNNWLTFSANPKVNFDTTKNCSKVDTNSISSTASSRAKNFVCTFSNYSKFETM